MAVVAAVYNCRLKWNGGNIVLAKRLKCPHPTQTHSQCTFASCPFACQALIPEGRCDCGSYHHHSQQCRLNSSKSILSSSCPTRRVQCRKKRVTAHVRVCDLFSSVQHIKSKNQFTQRMYRIEQSSPSIRIYIYMVYSFVCLSICLLSKARAFVSCSKPQDALNPRSTGEWRGRQTIIIVV